MINNFNSTGRPESTHHQDQITTSSSDGTTREELASASSASTARGSTSRAATARATSEYVAPAPLSLAAQRTAVSMSAHVPEIPQPLPYLGDRRYPIIQIRTGNASQKAESSRKIIDMLIEVRKGYLADSRESEIEINPNYQSSEFTFFTHQFNLAVQLDPLNPALNVMADQFTAREIHHMPLIMRPTRRAAQPLQQPFQPQAATTPARTQRRPPPTTPPTRGATRPLTTPPSGNLANPDTKRVRAGTSDQV